VSVWLRQRALQRREARSLVQLLVKVERSRHAAFESRVKKARRERKEDTIFFARRLVDRLDFGAQGLRLVLVEQLLFLRLARLHQLGLEALKPALALERGAWQRANTPRNTDSA
jgi:hypothetical protein